MGSKRLIVIGGGASGFFCAVNAARLNPQIEVIILEKSNKLLSKVKVSGGGRCNVTHACFSIAEMVKNYPRGAAFLKKAFHHFFTTDTIIWFEDRGVKLKTESDGRMFPITDNSQTIIDCLVKEANKYNVQILLNREVKAISMVDGKWSALLQDKSIFQADFICAANGGHPKSAQYEWLRQLHHSIVEPVPSLFTFNIPDNYITTLMGISVQRVMVKIMGTKLSEEGSIIITHWGLSGPAVLRLSAYGARELAASNYQFQVLINWLPDFNEQTLKEKLQQLRFEIASQKIIHKNPFALPNRLWQYLLDQSRIKEEWRWADLPSKEQNKLIKNLCAQSFSVKGKTTFKEEFVTAGGVSLAEMDVHTMQSKKTPHLFFAGEIIDADGITGGFNFQNAWTTGWIAAQAIAGS